MSLFNSYNKHTKPFDAKFGHIGLIATWFNKGFVVGKYAKLTRRKSFEGVLLSGPSGSGKTSRYLLKQLAVLRDCSLLINDPQGEMLAYGSGALVKHSKHIFSINYSDSSRSAGYNPFSRIKKPNDVNKLASLLMSNTLSSGNGDNFWYLASVDLTSALIRILLYQPVEYHNLCNLIRLLKFFSVQQDKVDKMVAKTNDEELILAYKAIITVPEKTLQNVVASVKAALQVFDDPEIARTTAYDHIDFDLCRKESCAIFLNNSLGDSKYLSVLNSIFFSQFYAFALEKLPQKDDKPIYVILEECSSSLSIPNLPQAMATSRKAKVGNFVVIQSFSALKSIYGQDAETIKSNARCKIWLTGQTSLDELREVETLSGKRIYKDSKSIERTVPLISADAIRMLPENRSLILSDNHPLIWAKSSQFHRSIFFRRYAKLPPAPLPRLIPDTPIPLLP